MSESRQVCLVIHPYTARKDLGAGHDRYAYELMSGLAAQGTSCSLFETGHHKSIPQAMAAEVKAIWRLRKMRGPALYHATATANAQAPLTAGKHPLLTTIHDVLWFHVRARFDSRLKYLLKTRAIKRAAAGSDGIIVPFRSTADFLQEELGTPAERIHVVPYGHDDGQFKPLGEGENLPRPAFFPPQQEVVLFVGAVNFGKGVDTLIRAMPEVVRQVPTAQLVVGSGGWDIPLIRPIWEQSPVKGHIHFTGFIPEADLRAAYVHAAVTAFPSRYGFGLATLESMACGTPTVSGRVLDAPEFIGDAGLMADPDDETELAQQLTRVLTEPALATRLSAEGLRKAAAYRWKDTVARTAEVYRKYV